MLTTHISLLAQATKDELGLGGLPDQFNEKNLESGLMIAFGIAGGISLVVISYGALKFVLSQGNPQEVSKAKNTIIDGLIGLAIIVTAAGIVSFVMRAL